LQQSYGYVSIRER